MLDRNRRARRARRVVLRPPARPPAPRQSSTSTRSSTTCVGSRRSSSGSSRPTTSRERLRPGMTTGRGDRGGLRGVRGRARKAALGRQDAALHAVPAASRAPLPRRALRPPRARRTRCGALVPLGAGGDHDGGVGLSPRRRRVRVPVGDRGARRARARRARRPSATSSSATRQLVVDPATELRARLRVRGAPRTTRRCSATSARRIPPGSSTSSG